MWHQVQSVIKLRGFNRNFTTLWEHFLCAKKRKIRTLFNNSSPPHPLCCGAPPLWRVSWRMSLSNGLHEPEASACIVILSNNADDYNSILVYFPIQHNYKHYTAYYLKNYWTTFLTATVKQNFMAWERGCLQNVSFCVLQKKERKKCHRFERCMNLWRDTRQKPFMSRWQAKATESLFGNEGEGERKLNVTDSSCHNESLPAV